MIVALLATALGVGALLAVQTSVNLRLTAAVGTPFGASTIQLSVAAGVLILVTWATGGLEAIRHVADVPAWQLLGGVASPIYITTGILLFPRVGALVSAGLFVTGQVLASLLLDLGGFLGVDRQPVTPTIVSGAVGVVVGIAVIVRGQSAGHGRGPSANAGGTVGWLAAGVLAGAVLPIQGAVNAALRRTVGSAPAVGLLSFVVATTTIAIVLAALVALRRTPRPQLRPLRRMPWWGWLGGFAAATYVVATFTLIPLIGAAPTVALTVTGQQVAAAILDHRGYLGLPIRRLTSIRAAGLALLVAGSAMVHLG